MNLTTKTMIFIILSTLKALLEDDKKEKALELIDRILSHLDE